MPCSLIEKHWGLKLKKRGGQLFAKKKLDIYKQSKKQKEEKQLFAKEKRRYLQSKAKKQKEEKQLFAKQTN